ncbi:MAG: sialate O-acetylesterase [Phycisphaeraceae bacterium]
MTTPTRISPLRCLSILLAVLCLAGPAAAQDLPRGEDVVHAPAIGEGLSFHNAFQTNMVLQRDKPIRVWGWAEPGEQVTLSFAGKSAKATADKHGAWKAELPALPASAEPRRMTLKGESKTITLDNVLVGDVWVLGGQSNMEFPLTKVENGHLEIVSANYPEIRILTIPHGNDQDPQAGFERLHQWSDWSGRHFRRGDWDVCTPQNVRELSAIGFVFARRVHKAAGVPIGVINTSRGGTTVETWTPDPVIRAIAAQPAKDLMAKWDADVAAWDAEADLARRVEQHKQYIERMTKQGNEIPANRRDAPTDLRPGPIGNHNHPSHCYNGMIAPLEGLAVKGAIFHQGYNNCFNGTEGARMYRAVFPEMIKAWRAAFGDPDMPFAILSLCTAGDIQTRDDFTQKMFDAGPFIREAQFQTFMDFYGKGDKHIGFVSTYDLNRRWYHPQLKLPAGERAARWALNSQYGINQVQWKPPMIVGTTAEGGKMVLEFDVPVGAVDDGGPIEGFALAGRDRRFHPADAQYFETGKDDRGRPRYDRKRLVLSSPMVAEPLAYRYAWSRNPMGNLQADRNSDIPLPTQRNDAWGLLEAPLGVLGDDEADWNNRQLRGRVLNALRDEDTRRRYIEAQQFIEANKDKVERAGAN